ncbi:MAG: LysE family transporter [Thermoflexales bacterium]|nr:LysE family transporter [Thermoflexales bacterium]
MEPGLLVQGIVIGFSIAAPVGPIGVLCIRRTLAEGRLAGLVSGLGAASADAIYGCIAAFGLSFVSNVLVGQQAWLRLVGGAFLCYLGITTFLARPADVAHNPAPSKRGLLGMYASTFVLTLTNPMTILSFVMIFAGLGLGGESRTWLQAALLVLGVFCGSALWWLTLSGGVGWLRASFSPRMMVWVNRLAGAIITAFGLWALLSGARYS